MSTWWNFSQICRAVSSQLRHVSTIGKKYVKQQYLLHMFSQCGVLQPTSGWDRLTSLGHSCKFQRISRIGFVTAATSLTGGQPNFTRCLAVSWAGILYIHFGLFPFTEFCQAQNSFYVQILPSPMLAVLLHGTRTAGVNQTLRRWQRAPPIFARVAITLGISPHSTTFMFAILLPVLSTFLFHRSVYGWFHHIIMAALRSRCGYYILVLFLLLLFPGLISAIADWMSTILPHMVCPSANLECRSEMCCTRLAENAGPKKSPPGHYRTNLSGYIFTWHISTIGKNLLNSNVVNFGYSGWDHFVSLGHTS